MYVKYEFDVKFLTNAHRLTINTIVTIVFIVSLCQCLKTKVENRLAKQLIYMYMYIYLSVMWKYKLIYNV